MWGKMKMDFLDHFSRTVSDKFIPLLFVVIHTSFNV